MIEAVVFRTTIIINAAKAFLVNVLNNPISTFVGLILLFIGSIFFFWMIYIFLHHSSLSSIILYKGKKLHGFTLPTYAFYISGELREQKLVEAQNNLHISKIFGVYYPRWASFSQDTSLQRQFPDQKVQQEEFQDTFTRGLTPTELIETNFIRYSTIKYKFARYVDNNIKVILPFQTMQEYYGLNVQQTQVKILSKKEQFYELQKIASNLLKVFENKNTSNLGELSFQLKNIVNSLSLFENKEKVKEIIYGYLLEIIGSYQITMEFDFSEFKPIATYFDLFYLSLQNNTSNRPSDITPVTYGAKIICWLQMTFSYFLLAFSVAVMINVIKYLSNENTQ